MNPTINIAVRAARKAGDIILRYHNQINLLTITNKGTNDFASEINKAAEDIIINEIRNTFPEHSIFSEKSKKIMLDSKLKWVIDPLDCTLNYLHGFPQYAISIAMLKNNIPIHAVIYDPFKEELFTASKGEGAYMNDTRLRITKNQGLKDNLIGTGFPFKTPKYLDNYLKMFKAISVQVADIRCVGSVALDLAYVAASRIDGFWEIGLNIWDTAAGVLLIIEAGGFVGDFNAENKYFTTGELVAGNESTYKEILKTIKPFVNK